MFPFPRAQQSPGLHQHSWDWTYGGIQRVHYHFRPPTKYYKNQAVLQLPIKYTKSANQINLLYQSSLIHPIRLKKLAYIINLVFQTSPYWNITLGTITKIATVKKSANFSIRFFTLKKLKISVYWNGKKIIRINADCHLWYFKWVRYILQYDDIAIKLKCYNLVRVITCRVSATHWCEMK